MLRHNKLLLHLLSPKKNYLQYHCSYNNTLSHCIQNFLQPLFLPVHRNSSKNLLMFFHLMFLQNECRSTPHLELLLKIFCFQYLLSSRFVLLLSDFLNCPFHRILLLHHRKDLHCLCHRKGCFFQRSRCGCQDRRDCKLLISHQNKKFFHQYQLLFSNFEKLLYNLVVDLLTQLEIEIYHIHHIWDTT